VRVVPRIIGPEDRCVAQRARDLDDPVVVIPPRRTEEMPVPPENLPEHPIAGGDLRGHVGKGDLRQVDVVVGVVAHGMSLGRLLPQQLRKEFPHHPDDEEGGPDVLPSEDAQQPGCGVRVGTVVESQADPPPFRVAPEDLVALGAAPPLRPILGEEFRGFPVGGLPGGDPVGVPIARFQRPRDRLRQVLRVQGRVGGEERRSRLGGGGEEGRPGGKRRGDPQGREEQKPEKPAKERAQGGGPSGESGRAVRVPPGPSGSVRHRPARASWTPWGRYPADR